MENNPQGCWCGNQYNRRKCQQCAPVLMSKKLDYNESRRLK
nr:MAG TPA: hypothetical protein [Siphoviridae sp. cta6m1]